MNKIMYCFSVLLINLNKTQVGMFKVVFDFLCHQIYDLHFEFPCLIVLLQFLTNFL